MRHIAVAGLALVMLAGCGGAAQEEEVAACEEWVAAFDVLFRQTGPFVEDAFAAVNQAYVGTATEAEVRAQLEASAADLAAILTEIEALGPPPEYLATVVSLTREGLDLGRQGYELLLAGRQADASDLVNEGGILLADGLMRLNSAAGELAAAGPCTDLGK
ncbi:MAG: hypothetical protein ABIJ48_01400 [Actinomycetota bacterium]